MKKGEIYFCGKDLICEVGNLCFTKGEKYEVLRDHWLVNNQGLEHLVIDTSWEKHFLPWKKAPTEGTRFNEGKLKWSLFPFSVFGNWWAETLKCEDEYLAKRHIETILTNVLEFQENPLELLIATMSLHVKEKKPCKFNISLPLDGCIRVLMFGEQKYDAHNWKKGLKVTEILDSYARHFKTYLEGQELDEESKLPHLDHMICNAMFATWMVQNKPKFDDRWKQ